MLKNLFSSLSNFKESKFIRNCCGIFSMKGLRWSRTYQTNSVFLKVFMLLKKVFQIQRCIVPNSWTFHPWISASWGRTFFLILPYTCPLLWTGIRKNIYVVMDRYKEEYIHLPHLQVLANNCVYSSHTDIKLCTYCLYRHTTVLIHEILYTLL